MVCSSTVISFITASSRVASVRDASITRIISAFTHARPSIALAGSALAVPPSAVALAVMRVDTWSMCVMRAASCTWSCRVNSKRRRASLSRSARSMPSLLPAKSMPGVSSNSTPRSRGPDGLGVSPERTLACSCAPFTPAGRLVTRTIQSPCARS